MSIDSSIVIEALQKLESMKLIRLNRIIGNWYSIYCPFHNEGNEKKPSCGVLLQDEVRNGQNYSIGMFHCFSCSAVYSFQEGITKILQERSIDNRSGIEWLKENVGGFEETEFDYLLPRDLVKDLNNKFALNYIINQTEKKKEYVSEEELATYRFTTQYMYDRKLTDEIIEKFDVGVDLHYIPADRVREVPCITFPVRDSLGNTLFIYRRAIATKNFYMPAGLEKPIYGLYELGGARNSVILCESIFNALTCYVYGYPALALFGTGTQNQIKELKLLGIKEFILGLDPDEAGDRGCKKLKNALKSIAIVRRMKIPLGKDINDLSMEEFSSALEERM